MKMSAYRYFSIEDVCDSLHCKAGLQKSMFCGISALMKPRLRKNRGLHFGKTGGNNKKNNTDFSKTDLSLYPAKPEPMDVMDGYREQIKTNIEYNYLFRQYPAMTLMKSWISCWRRYARRRIL